jgi:hypothetical protein
MGERRLKGQLVSIEQRPKQYEEGFALIFMSILITVAALIFVSFLPGQEAGDMNQKMITDTEKLEKVEEAMRGFMAANCRRPCPADGQYSENTPYFGHEAANPGGCTGGAPVAPLGPDAGTGYVVAGTIPTVSLGLDDSYAYDEYGRRFTYVVDTRATGVSSCSALETSSMPGGVTIENTTGGTVIDNVMYAYIGHGASGYGAWPAQGSANGDLTPAQSAAMRINSGSTDNDMQTNAGVDAVGAGSTFTYNTTNFTNVKIQHARTPSTFAAGGADTGFDDLLFYRNDLNTSFPEFLRPFR